MFDLANNMRLVLLPSDTKMGTVVYKLRASDADEDYPLQFRAFGKFTPKHRKLGLIYDGQIVFYLVLFMGKEGAFN